MGDRLIVTPTLNEIEVHRPDKSGLKMTKRIIKRT
jgi:hypothetical protein